MSAIEKDFCRRRCVNILTKTNPLKLIIFKGQGTCFVCKWIQSICKWAVITEFHRRRLSKSLPPTSIALSGSSRSLDFMVAHSLENAQNSAVLQLRTLWYMARITCSQQVPHQAAVSMGSEQRFNLMTLGGFWSPVCTYDWRQRPVTVFCS